MPRPWEPGYKPPSAAEAFDPKAPLPASAMAALAYLDAKDARIAELEIAIREALPNVYAMADPPRARQILEHALKGENLGH